MKALFVHAHFDDYEFTAAGTFELLRRRDPEGFQARVIVCTDGCAGHHLHSREDTARIRLAEQKESARLGKYEFRQLLLPNGAPPREACLQNTIELHAALWRAIRDFEPDYLFCPPLAVDPLVGIHNDHQAVAHSVRHVAYMINVPHAFTPEYPAEAPGAPAAPCKVPVIVNVHDSYMTGANAADLIVDVEEAFETICQLSWCHQSQIREWLPWVGGRPAPASYEEWRDSLRSRFARRSRELGLPALTPPRAIEPFRITAWGAVPTLQQLLQDFPPLSAATTPLSLNALSERLNRWRCE